MGLGAVAAQAMSTVITHSSTAQPLGWTMLVLAGLAMILFVILVKPTPRR
jgi:hypothetical protein